MKRSQINKVTKQLYKLLSEVQCKLIDIEGMMADAHEQADDYYQGKSEKWQEGDNGSDFYERMEGWELSMQTLGDVQDDIDERITDLLVELEDLL